MRIFAQSAKRRPAQMDQGNRIKKNNNKKCSQLRLRQSAPLDVVATHCLRFGNYLIPPLAQRRKQSVAASRPARSAGAIASARKSAVESASISKTERVGKLLSCSRRRTDGFSRERFVFLIMRLPWQMDGIFLLFWQMRAKIMNYYSKK